MKKPGQPDSALALTAGRRSLLGQLRYGAADRAAQSMAANWLRDLTVHHGESLRRLEVNAMYCALMTGTLNNAAQQGLAVDWIEGLLFTAKENATMSDYHDQPSGADDDDQPSGADDDDKAHGINPHPANSRQVGGSHYAKPVQHWDFVASNDYGYLEGQITKYLFRWREKNGLQDVQKAAHFLQKLTEVVRTDEQPISLQAFLTMNTVPDDERAVMVAIHAYHETLNPFYLDEAQRAMKRVLATAATVPHHPV